MWVTNIELDQRITKLEQKIIQNLSPEKWQYKWQIWFDEINKTIKFWNWNDWSSVAPDTQWKFKLPVWTNLY